MQTDETTLHTLPTLPSHENVREEWSRALALCWQAVRAVLPAFLLTRLVFLLLTYFGGVLVNVPGASSFAPNLKTVFYSWYHWDATHYLNIAASGYLDSTSTGYFPLYPALVHLLSGVLHADLLFTSLMVSNLTFFGALLVLYRFVSTEWSIETARRTVFYLAIFPTALFFFTASAEPLLLLFLIGSIYSMRQGFWWLAGLLGGLAALTYITGILLFFLFVYEFFRQHRELFLPERSQPSLAPTARAFALLPLLAAVLIPLGFAVYALALKRQFGDAFVFLHPGEGKTGLFYAPWTAPGSALHALFSSSFSSLTGIHSFFEVALLIFALGTLLLSFVGSARLRREQWPLTFFTLLLLLFSLMLPDMPAARHSLLDPIPFLQHSVLQCFLCFIVLAQYGRRSWLHHLYIVLALPLLSMLVLQLFAGRWLL